MSDTKDQGRGRPTTFTAEIAHTICSRVASGESLKAICRDEGMPAEATVRGWVLDDREGFSALYARARDLQAESWADEILEISDDGSNDWMAREGKDDAPGYVVNGEHIQRSKLRADTRRWLLAKLKPKQYGDVSKHEHSGPEGGPIATETVTFYLPKNGRDERES
jgi:hypothetical protein